MEIEELKKEVLEKRNKLGRCPVCNQGIKDRPIALYQGLIDSLYQIYRWCGEKRRHEFKTKEIKHLFGRNEYARFGDLMRFGGIVYKPKREDGKGHKAEFGLNMARAKEFFGGEYKIPVQIILNQITNEIEAATYVSIRDFPKLYELLDKEGLYDYEIMLNVKIDWEKQKKVGLQPVSKIQKNLFS